MALPSTGLQLHVDASVSDDLYQSWQSGTPFHTGAVTDGVEAGVWDDADARDITLLAGVAPTWVSSVPVMVLPNLYFNGTTSTLAAWDIAGTVEVPVATVISNSAFVVLAAVRISGGSTNSTSAWLNDAVIGDGSGGYWGVFVRNNSGAFSFEFYNWDGSASSVSIAASVNTDYVIAFWHTGGSLYAEVYSNAGLVGSGNTPSGNTTSLTNQLRVGLGGVGFYNGKIGEIAVYNSYNSTDKANAVTYFADKWINGAGDDAPTLSTMTPDSAYANPDVPVTLTGVTFTGLGLDGDSGAFNVVSGFTFSNLDIDVGGEAGTVDIELDAALTPDTYDFTFTTSGGSSDGTSDPLVFTITTPGGGGGSAGPWGTIR